MKRADLQKGKLDVTLNQKPRGSAPVGRQWLQLDATRDALLYVPQTYSAYQPAPFALMLHGAGGDAQHGMSLLEPYAEASGSILMAPFSRRGMWDIIDAERFGPDVLFISAALQHVFHAYTIESTRLAIGGFSDGASYALSMGLINGALFSHVLAFSPGFYYAPNPEGKPFIYISHGVADDVLPIRYCSRRIVPKLEQEEYTVLYREFEGTHIVPDHIRVEAVGWFLEGPKP